MRFTLEMRALEWAALVALVSLGGAWLLALALQTMPGSSAVPTSTFSGGSSSGIAASAELVDQGHEFYGMSCSHCHGDDATGDEGPNLHNLSISNARISKTIKNGIKGEMPTFAKKYDDKQIAALVSYLRTLR